MAYSTAEEVLGMIKGDALNSIIGDTYIEDEAQRLAKIMPLVEDAIADADGEIDGYLVKRYPVPLLSVPRSIAKFSKDIAIYNLFSRIGIDEGSKEKNYLNRYNAAVAFLKLVAEGKVDIGVGAETEGISTKASGFTIRNSNRLFSRESMRGL